MDLSIYLPVAGDSVPLIPLLAIGLLVGGLSGFFGLGAGFLLTPLLITIGVPPIVAAASCGGQCVAAASAGAHAHVRARTIDRRMAGLLLAGGLVGGTIGVQAIRVLRLAGQADLAVTLVYVLFLGALGIHLLRDSLEDLEGGRSRRHREETRHALPPLLVRLIARLPGKVEFAASGVRRSFLAPLGTGVLVGLIGAFAGIGGGFLLVPAAIVLMGMPIQLATGTVLLLVCLSSANVTLQHAAFNGTVDVILALILFATSMAGSWAGGRVHRWLRAEQLRILLAVIVLFAAAKLVLGLVLPPEVTTVLVEERGIR